MPRLRTGLGLLRLPPVSERFFCTQSFQRSMEDCQSLLRIKVRERSKKAMSKGIKKWGESLFIMEYFKIFSVRKSLFIITVLLCLLSLQRNGIYQDKVRLWADVVKKSPLKARPYFTLGTAYKEKGDIDRAIECYRTAIRLKPDYVDAYNNLGIDYLEKGMIDEAIKVFEEAILIKPLRADSYNNLGIAYMKKGLYRDAIGYFETAIRLMPDFQEAYINLMAGCMSLNLPENPEECLMRLRGDK